MKTVAIALASCIALVTADAARADTFKLEEATFDDLQRAMDSGALSSVEITALYLNRVYAS